MERLVLLIGVSSCLILRGSGSVGPRVGDASVSGDRPRTRPFGSRGGVDPQLILRRIHLEYRMSPMAGCLAAIWLKRLST